MCPYGGAVTLDYFGIQDMANTQCSLPDPTKNMKNYDSWCDLTLNPNDPIFYKQTEELTLAEQNKLDIDDLIQAQF